MDLGTVSCCCCTETFSNSINTCSPSHLGIKIFEEIKIQVAKLPFEKGAEWVVSRCREVVGPVAVGGGLVAKQPLHEELLHTAEFFLKSYRVQSEAAALAELFNRRLGGAAGVREGLQLAFVHSFVYKVRHAPEQTVAPEQKEAVEAAAAAEAAEQALWYKVEEELSGPWIKWNNNNGRVMRWSPAAFAVLSQPSSPPPAETTRDVPSELSTLEVIAEEEGDAENDEHASQLSAAARTTRDSVTDSISDASVPLSESSAAAQSETELEPAHVPQCFSHFSHSVTDGRKLVCDLQGTWNATDGFVLTDPVIHYAGDRAGRRGGRNGRTDKGLEGVRQFFCTHICNPLCRRLGLEQPRSSLIAIAVLEFLDQKVKSGEQHADGWGGGELCNGSCEILEASGTTADPEEVTAVVEALLYNGVLCRGHDGYGYLTAEASLALDLTRQYFAAWKHRKQCTLPLMKRSLRAWREVAIRAQELRQECCVRACTVVESRDFAREAASFLKKPLGPKTLAVVADRVSSLVVRAPHHLQGLVNMIFDLAVSRSRHSIWMARLCNAVEDRLEKFDDENNTPANQTGPLRSKIPFITTLRKLCQTQLVNMPESLEEETKEEHDRMKGYVCFLGALFTAGIFSDMVLHICLKRLLFPKQASESMPEWSQRLRRLRAIKCLCALMASPTGRLMGRPEARDFMSYIDKYFEHMRHVKEDIQTLPGGEQLADMLQDTIDLRFWWR